MGRSGAIEINAGKVFIELTYFYNNSKNIGSSLALYFISDSKFKGEALILNCIFEKNNAVLGSSIYVRAAQISIYIKKCSFIMNWASQGFFNFSL